MTRIWAALLILLLTSCVGVSKSELSRAKAIAVSKERFAASPLGFELTLANFEAEYGKLLKHWRYTLKSAFNTGNTDTIHRFHKGRTEIFFYKPMKLEAKPVAGNIYTPKITLYNEIKVGMTRKEFFWRFSDWIYDDADTLTLDSPAVSRRFTFVFKRDKLKAIQFGSSRVTKCTDNTDNTFSFHGYNIQPFTSDIFDCISQSH